MRCHYCNNDLPAEGEACIVCGRKPKQSDPPFYWLIPALAATMIVLLALVVYRARDRAQAKLDGGPVEGTPAPAPQGGLFPGYPIADPEPDPLDAPIVVDESTTMKTLLDIYDRLDRQNDALTAASVGVSRVRERIGGLDEGIQTAIREGGPFADPGFRSRWEEAVSNQAEASLPPLPWLDKEFATDLVHKRPVTRRRVADLVAFTGALRKHAVPIFKQERAMMDFVRRVVSPGVSCLYVSNPYALDQAGRRINQGDFVVAALYAVDDKVYFQNGDSFKPTDHVDMTDVLIMSCRSTGFVRAAYEHKKVDADKCIGELVSIERALKTLLDGGKLQGPEALPTAPVRHPKPDEPLNHAVPSWIREASQGVDSETSSPPQPGGAGGYLDTPKGREEMETRAKRLLEEDTAGGDKGEPQVPPDPATPGPARGGVTPLGVRRRWTDVGGQSCEALLVSVDGDWVLLEGTEGERKRYLAVNFSEEDQDYLKQFSKRPNEGAGDSVPKKSRSGQPRRRPIGNRSQSEATRLLFGRP